MPFLKIKEKSAFPKAIGVSQSHVTALLPGSFPRALLLNSVPLNDRARVPRHGKWASGLPPYLHKCHPFSFAMQLPPPSQTILHSHVARLFLVQHHLHFTEGLCWSQEHYGSLLKRHSALLPMRSPLSWKNPSSLFQLRMKRHLGILASLAASRRASLVLCPCRPCPALHLEIQENQPPAFADMHAWDITSSCPSEYGKEAWLPKLPSHTAGTFSNFPAEEEREAWSPQAICSQAKEMLFCLSISFCQLLWFITYILGPMPENHFVEYPAQLEPGLSRRCLAQSN